MCLAIPAKIVELLDDDMAKVEVEGVRKEVSLAMVDAGLDDYVIIHVGYALSKIDAEEAEKTIALFAEMAELGMAENAS